MIKRVHRRRSHDLIEIRVLSSCDRDHLIVVAIDVIVAFAAAAVVIIASYSVCLKAEYFVKCCTTVSKIPFFECIEI